MPETFHMSTAETEILSMVNAETAAWNVRDADALVSLFHPDTVWPWPPNADAPRSDGMGHTVREV